MIVDGLLLVLLFLAPGYAGWLAFGSSWQSPEPDSAQSQLSVVEILFFIIWGGIIVVLWVGMVLAELGLFSIWSLFGVVLLGCVLVGGWGLKNGRSLNPFREAHFQPITFLILPILGAAILLSPQPFEYINGGRDHGLYVNTGLNIAKTGQILIEDEAITAVPAASRALLINPETSVSPQPVPGPWSEGQRLPGMTIRDLDQGIIAPHAFQLYAVFIAIFAAIGAVKFALVATIVLGLLGALAVYIVAARLFGQPVGLLTFFLLVVSLAQVWYTKKPFSGDLASISLLGRTFCFPVDARYQEFICCSACWVKLWVNALG